MFTRLLELHRGRASLHGKRQKRVQRQDKALEERQFHLKSGHANG